MVQELDSIPERLQAVEYALPVEKPLIEVDTKNKMTIRFRDVEIPQGMTLRFLRQCGIDRNKDEPLYALADRIRDALGSKRLFLRGRLDDNILKWFGIVTGEFKEVYPRDVHQKVWSLFHGSPRIRYFKENQSAQLEYPVDEAVRGLYAHINTGSHGLFGGNGRMSLRLGLSWYNDVCTNWTLFLDDFLLETLGEKGRVVHRGGEDFYDDTLVERLEQLKGITKDVAKKIEASKEISLSRKQLADYLEKYGSKGLNKKVQKGILERIDTRAQTSVYDVAFDLTQLCQTLTRSGVRRSAIESLAGELILCSDKVLESLNL